MSCWQRTDAAYAIAYAKLADAPCKRAPRHATCQHADVHWILTGLTPGNFACRCWSPRWSDRDRRVSDRGGGWRRCVITQPSRKYATKRATSVDSRLYSRRECRRVSRGSHYCARSVQKIADTGETHCQPSRTVLALAILIRTGWRAARCPAWSTARACARQVATRVSPSRPQRPRYMCKREERRWAENLRLIPPLDLHYRQCSRILLVILDSRGGVYTIF